MRLSLPGVAIATLSFVAAALPGTATAATTTLFVDRNVTCSDSGTGTMALPFCDIAAAAGSALLAAGATVVVDPGAGDPVGDAYGTGLAVTRSGTQVAPITFTTGRPEHDGVDSVVLDPSPFTGPVDGTGITFDQVHDVTFDGIGVRNLTGPAVTILDSSRITLTHSVIATVNGVPVTVAGATSTDDTVTRNWLSDPESTGEIQVVNGAAGTVVSDNELDMPGSVNVTEPPAIHVTGASTTTVTNNTLTPSTTDFCPIPIEVDGGATGTALENNALLPAPACLAAGTPVVTVAADSTAGTTVDYNDVGDGTDTGRYDWAGTSYATPDAFTAATSQGGHDLATTITEDSADPATPGLPATDILGHARVDDPLVPNMFGSIVDRGAIESTDPLTAALTMSATRAPTGATVVANVDAANGWTPTTSFGIDFGDGTPPVTSATGQLPHQYASTGTFHVVATAKDGTTSATSTASITIVPPAPEVIHPVVTAQGGQGATVDLRSSTDSWNITRFSCDFGDGSAVVSGPECVHQYPTLGTYPITTTIVDAAGNSATTTSTFTTAGSRFHGLTPTRLLDTRNGTGTGGVVGKVTNGHTVVLRIAGASGIPAGVRAVALNVTVTNSATGGDVIVYPDGVTRPTVSTVNFVAGQTVPNLTVVPVGADGSVDLTAVGGPLDLIADATGYFVQDSAANGYTALPSHRLLDTRSGTGGAGPVASFGTLPLTVAGAGGVPATGATAVALNVTVTAPTQAGFVSAFPAGTTRPNTSNVNFTKGETVANLVIVPVGADGRVDLFNDSSGTTQLVADVVGYFLAGGDTYVPLTPFRAFDTRSSTPIAARTLRSEPIPVVHPDGIVLNVTVTTPTAPGFVLAAPAPLPPGLDLNAASTLNWSAPNTTLANLAIPAATSGLVNIFNGSDGTTNVLGDVLGYFDADTPQG